MIAQQAEFSGVKNKTDKEQVLCYDGQPFYFKPGQVRIVSAAVADHAESRIVVKEDKLPDGKFTGIPYGHRLFEKIPLHEALKVADLDEDPKVVAARERAAQDVAAKKALRDEILADLRKEGWAPQEQTKKGGK